MAAFLTFFCAIDTTLAENKITKQGNKVIATNNCIHETASVSIQASDIYLRPKYLFLFHRI